MPSPTCSARSSPGFPRIVYEFDAPDLRTGTMYPAMARTFREVGTQFAAMFAYDMLAHRLAQPRLADPLPEPGLHAAQGDERDHRGGGHAHGCRGCASYGPYPRNTRFGDFRVSAEDDLAELVARDAFLYAGSTRSSPPDLAALRRIAGYGSSPAVAL